MFKRNRTEMMTGIAALVLTVGAAVLFNLSYTTGYYTYGQLNSGLVTLLLAGALVFELAALILRGKFADKAWPKFITFGVTGTLVAAAMLLIGDRVEGIGTCIITDYDSGHGGEEAIYMSIASAILMLVAVIYNIIGSFSKDRVEKGKGRSFIKGLCVALSVVIVLAGVLIPTSKLAGWKLPFGGAKSAAKTYKVSYNQNTGNVDDMPGYQFLCSDFSGMVKADSRFFVDVALTLDGEGGYKLLSDAYVIEAGKRAEVGDDTGLGLVLTTNAEGTYTDNGDGTYITAAPTHAVFEMQTDTYSMQMKEAANMNVDGNADDGVYDSSDVPAVLDFVPETMWTLDKDSKAIVGWVDPNAEAEAAEAEDVPVEEPVAAEGLVVTSDDGGTTMTFNPDGSYVFAFAAYNIEDAGTYAYDGATLTVTNANGAEATAEGDPLKLHYVSAVSDQLAGDFTIPAADLGQLLSAAQGDSNEVESLVGEADGLTITSDDDGTTLTFNPGGS